MNTLLIIDDDHAVRTSLVDFFEDQSWLVLEAESAEQALDILRTQRVHAAIVDLRLPGINGADFIQQIIAENHKVCCILCTGSPEYALPPAFIQNSYISNNIYHKPVLDISGLELALKTLIQINS